jgi:8-oxo-dGTP diphosphatase
MPIPWLTVMSGLILNKDGQALMGLRKQGKPRPGLWEYPGGKVEPGEVPLLALYRELHEELGIETRPLRWLGRMTLELEVNFQIELWTVSIEQGTPQALDHDELRWIFPAEAVIHFPCTPTTYMLHQSVMGELIRRRRDGEMNP